MAMRPEMPNIRVSRRGKIAIGVLIGLIIVISLLGTVARIYTDWLWFGEVGYRSVYTRIFWTRVALFFVFGIGLAVAVGSNVFLAYRMRPPFRPISQEQENLERYRVALEPRKRPLFIVLLLILFIGSGMAAQNNWKIWQAWRVGVKFGVQDPQFHRDISFFAWDYPAYRLLLGFGFNAIIFSLLLSLAVHYIFGAFRIATPGPKLTISARRHITILVFVFVALKACAYWLDRYGLVFSNRGKVTGASYTDVHASLPAKTILFWAAVLIAIAVLASLWLKSAQIAYIAFIALLVMSIGINGIYPALVQQISVKPNASDKEAPYILRNINATRAAYGITTSTAGGPVNYTANYGAVPAAPPSVLSTDKSTVPNIRLTDPNVVSPTFTNAQQLKNIYGFPAKLDIDRYVIDGTTSDYIVAARELKESNLTGSQTNWINKHTVYTHGYGFVAGDADRDVNAQSDFTVGDIPVVSKNGFPTVTQPRIYYGEEEVDYSIVGATGDRENDGSDQHNSYDGKGGVSLGNFVNRLAYAVKYRQGNFVLNDAVSAKGAKVIYNRDPRERVQKVAPFLKVDGDPYPSVVNGRIVWMLDAYTTMSNYPYSERQSLGALTTDSLSTTNRTASQPNDQINYIRNSVKATVDAYDGTVTLYDWDETDPVLKTWMKLFPGLVKPKADLLKQTELMQHIRYPQDLFEVQRSLLTKYHVDDPVQFYNGSDQWTVPDDPTLPDAAVDQPPYYVLAGSAAGTGSAQYQLTSPMKVNNRPNMAAYISVDSDATDLANYGKFEVLKLTPTTAIQGPQQIYQRFNSEPAISQDLSLLRGGGSKTIEGNLLSLPIGNTFLYVEPLYVQGAGSNAFPLLQRVLVSYGELIGYGRTLSAAIAGLSPVGNVPALPAAGATSPPPSTTPTATAGTPRPTPTVTATAPGGTVAPGSAALLKQLDIAFDNLQNAYKSGDFTAVGTAQAEVNRLLQQYLQTGTGAASTPPASTPKATPTPTPKPS
ncbi:MAG: conserved rane protein of unknown function [Frankiales bacterium]|nr:conserved rane protein of unknown function [Frankiales bacterium]